MASLSPTNARFAPSWPSESNCTTLREASFSSYLNTSEETYIHTLIESSQNKEFVTKHQHNRRTKKAEDDEIGVFSADKYFSSGIDQEPDNSSIKSRSLRRYQQSENSENGIIAQIISRTNSSKLKTEYSRTGSTQSSRLSSHSQSMLLKRLHMNQTNNQPRMSHSKAHSGMMSLLSCSCCAKKSVEIDADFKNNYGSRSSSISNGLHTGYSSKGFMTRSFTTNQDARRSVEVFGFNDLDDESNSFNLQKRLNMISWDAIPTRTAATTVEINTSGAPSETCIDTESDASSDLFEIECLSCSANPLVQEPQLMPVIQEPQIVPMPLNGNGSPTTRYAPSEASIDWSVVTASAAEFSDSEDPRKSSVNTHRKSMTSKSDLNGKMSVNKEGQKPVSSILLGCKNQKAVSVANDVHQRTTGRRKSESQRMHRFSDSFVPVTRFQTEAKLAILNERRRQSLSPELLYIQ